jgi:hypothetical protein
MPRRNTKPTSNVSIIAEIMEFSKAGPLAQVLIVTAIQKYCEQVTADPERVRANMQNGLISADTWIEVARIVGQELEDAYKTPTSAT